MKKSKRLLLGILIGALAVGGLTGCKSPAKKVKLEKGEVKEQSIVLTVGDIGVEYREIRNYCYLLKRQYEGNFGADIWGYALGDSDSIGNQAKEEVLNMVTQLKVIKEEAQNAKITLTNDEKDEALQKAEEVMADTTAEERREYFLSVQNLSELYEENLLANKMFYVATDEADTQVSDETAKQIKIQFLQVMTKGTNKDGLELNMDETAKKTAAKKARALLKQAGGEEDFLSFAQSNTDNQVTELTLGTDDKTIAPQAVAAAFSLTKKEMSPVIEGDDGYYIIYCVDDNDQDATYAKKEQIIRERQTKMFKKKYAEWLGSSEVRISNSFWKIFKI